MYARAYEYASAYADNLYKCVCIYACDLYIYTLMYACAYEVRLCVTRSRIIY